MQIDERKHRVSAREGKYRERRRNTINERERRRVGHEAKMGVREPAEGTV